MQCVITYVYSNMTQFETVQGREKFTIKILNNITPLYILG